jgi:regulator of RNase E activity RraA/3-hydroxyisobutyrate dehydrogenase-like beta-hydroxyacid dehydrogenase
MEVMANSTATLTAGILYCGELGSAFGKLLRKSGLRVVTTCQGRSAATEGRALAAGIEILPALADVVAQSHFVFSFVLPSVAVDVAREYLHYSHLRPKGSIFIEGNSIGVQAMEQIERLIAEQGIPLVDATINGGASKLEELGVMHLSGPQTGKVAAICHQLLRVNLLSEDIGSASQLKLLMSGIAKGLPALFLEISALAERAGMLEEFLQSCGQFYPGLMKIIDRTLITYPRHASRRVGEIADIEEMGRDLRIRLGMTHEACELTRLAAGLDWQQVESCSAADIRMILQFVTKSFPLEDEEEHRRRYPMTPSKPKSAELYPGPGFRIRMDFPRLDAALMKRFQDYEVPEISDVLNRLYALDPAITCQSHKRERLCGPVCTVRVFPGDNLMVHKALDVAKPNDIVIIDAHGARSVNAVLGDTICTKAKHRGIAGFIIDGFVRDMPGIEELDIPVFARGTTPVGPLHRGPGEINYPISCGGAVVNPGDVAVADISGIVVIPQEAAEDVLKRLDGQKAYQEKYLAAVRRGEFSNAWVDEILKQHQCPLHDSKIEILIDS